MGGVTKGELLAELESQGVQLNEAGRTLFAHDQFTTAPTTSILTAVELAVADLGLAVGGTIGEIHQRAAQLGLSLCPLELGPHLRLQFLDQPEGSVGHPPSQHRAPPGSITVASPEPVQDESIPKGFYLRRIEGILWLRGYRSGLEHLWSPEDRLVFCCPETAD